MYMQNDIAAAATPVFHVDLPRIDPAKRRAEVEQVIALATAAIPKTQMRKLGRLSFAAARDDDDHSYFGQIRSEPIGTSGVELRYPISARGTGDRDLDQVVAELVEVSDCVSRAARTLKKLGTLVREVADEALRTAKGGIAEMRVVAIGVTPGRTEKQLRVTVDVEMLGDDLTAGIERVCKHAHSGGIDRIEERLKELADKHITRRKVLAQAKVIGTTGWIDDSALRILDLSGLGRAAALKLLSQNRQVNISFGGDSGYDLMGGVHWDDGVIRGYVENHDRESTFRLEAEVLTIQAKGLPETIIASLVGRHLGELIDISYIPGSALITEVEESGDWLYLRLEIGASTIRDALASV